MPRLRYMKCPIHPKYRGGATVWKPIARCNCGNIYRAVNVFGAPAEQTAPDAKHEIIVWKEGINWRFAPAIDGQYDAIVTEEWMDKVYTTTDTERQAMLRSLAREIGMYDDDEPSSQGRYPFIGPQRL